MFYLFFRYRLWLDNHILIDDMAVHVSRIFYFVVVCVIGSRDFCFQINQHYRPS